MKEIKINTLSDEELYKLSKTNFKMGDTVRICINDSITEEYIDMRICELTKTLYLLTDLACNHLLDWKYDENKHKSIWAEIDLDEDYEIKSISLDGIIKLCSILKLLHSLEYEEGTKEGLVTAIQDYIYSKMDEVYQDENTYDIKWK